MDIDKIVAEMPKIKNPNEPRFPGAIAIAKIEGFFCHAKSIEVRDKNSPFNKLVEAQCCLLAEAGYRQVPSKKDIENWLRQTFPWLWKVCNVDSFAERIHCWLLDKKKKE